MRHTLTAIAISLLVSGGLAAAPAFAAPSPQPHTSSTPTSTPDENTFELKPGNPAAPRTLAAQRDIRCAHLNHLRRVSSEVLDRQQDYCPL